MSKSRLVLRLIVGVIGIQAVILSILVWNSNRLLDRSYQDIWQRTAQEQSLPLARALAAGNGRQDNAVLLPALGALRNHPSLRYAAVFDTRGELLASVGDSPYPVPAATAAHAAGDARVDVVRISLPLALQDQSLGFGRVRLFQ